MDTPSNEPDQLTIEAVLPPGEAAFDTVLRLSNQLGQLKDLAEEQEAALKKTNEQIKDISERRLPDLMTGLGLTEIMLRDGRKINVKPEYYASVPKDRMAAAVAWLKANNMAGIVKEELVVNVSRQDALIEACIPFTPQASIHPSTLRAFVKERIEANGELPREIFGVHVVDKAAVKNS